MKNRARAKHRTGAKSFRMWWPGTELNRRRQPFQGCALPPELPGHFSKPFRSRELWGLFASRRVLRECQPMKQPGTCAEPDDYSNARQFAQYFHSHPRRSRSTLSPIKWTRREILTCEKVTLRDPSASPQQRCNVLSYWPPAEEPCSPNHDASCGSCCAFNSAQPLMRSIDCRYVRSAASILCAT